MALLPARNEEQAVAGVVKALLRKHPGFHCLVVDDGSKDNTAEAAQKAGAYIVRHGLGMGYGAALQTGYKYALRKGFTCVVQLDADGQHEVDSIEVLLEPVLAGECDVAVGSRFLEGERRIPYRSSKIRRLGSFILGRLGSLLLGRKITDPTSGFQALNIKAMRFGTSSLFPADYPDLDVLLMLHYGDLRVTEVPVTMHPAQSGASMHRGWHIPYYVVKMLVSIAVVVLIRLLYPKKVQPYAP